MVAAKQPRITRVQARWLYERVQEYRAQAETERKSYDTDSDVARCALARFEGLLQALTGDWS
jgi:hypothetical protein